MEKETKKNVLAVDLIILNTFFWVSFSWKMIKSCVLSKGKITWSKIFDQKGEKSRKKVERGKNFHNVFFD